VRYEIVAVAELAISLVRVRVFRDLSALVRKAAGGVSAIKKVATPWKASGQPPSGGARLIFSRRCATIAKNNQCQKIS